MNDGQVRGPNDVQVTLANGDIFIIEEKYGLYKYSLNDHELGFINNVKDIEIGNDRPEANLGCATTEELFREMIARFTFSMNANLLSTKVEKIITLAEMLGSLNALEREYRTIDS